MGDESDSASFQLRRQMFINAVGVPVPPSTLVQSVGQWELFKLTQMHPGHFGGDFGINGGMSQATIVNIFLAFDELFDFATWSCYRW